MIAMQQQLVSSMLLKKISDFITQNRKKLMLIVSILSFVALLIQVLLVYPVISSILLAIAPSIIYFLSNFNIIDRDEKQKVRKKYTATWGISLTIFLNMLIILIVPTFTLFDTEYVLDVRRLLCILVDIITFSSIAYMLGRPIMKVRLLELANINLPVMMNLDWKSMDMKPGDLVLCKSKETNQNVIIPWKDRFLHMLILGPTGSGKTSQIILPALEQDLRNKEAGVTVIEPKGDLAEKAYAMAQYYGREAVYFNPISNSCPTFNPLYGKEEDVVENIVTAFKMLDPDSPQYFQDMNEQLLRNALRVLKRTMGNEATLIDLSRLISNTNGWGRKFVSSTFSPMDAPTESIKKENEDISNYFLGDYFNEKSKSFENTSGVRSQVSKIVSNKFLRKVLNPEGKSDIDFDKHLEEGTVICISTAQGKLRDLGRFLGYFIILNFQSSVFKRPGNENTRRKHFLYIDEFQSYSNPGFADMLTQGRSYRVASHLATQNRALIGMGSGRDGDDFVELVSTNARNVVLFPGGNYKDAKYYSDQFGQVDTVKIGEGSSKNAANPLIITKVTPVKDSYNVREETKPRMSTTDIIQRQFGEITYSIVQNNTLQPAGIGVISYIDKDLNATLDKMVEENNIMMAVGLDPNKNRNFDRNGDLNSDLNWDEITKQYKEIDELSKRRDDSDSENKVETQVDDNTSEFAIDPLEKFREARKLNISNVSSRKQQIEEEETIESNQEDDDSQQSASPNKPQPPVGSDDEDDFL